MLLSILLALCFGVSAVRSPFNKDMTAQGWDTVAAASSLSQRKHGKGASSDLASKFCAMNTLSTGCQRLGGNATHVNEADFLSTISNIQYVLTGRRKEAFQSGEITASTISLLDLKNVRMATHFWDMPEEEPDELDGDPDEFSRRRLKTQSDATARWEKVHFRDQDEDDYRSDFVETAEHERPVPIMSSLDAPLAPLLRGLTQGSGEWNTVGFPDFKKKSGKFYYELELRHGYANPQVGVATSRFVTLQNHADLALDLHDRGFGLGDGEECWAVNGKDAVKYHVDVAEWDVHHWSSPVIVGCAVDLDTGTIAFSSDGVWGDVPAFTGITHKQMREGVYPAATLEGKGYFRFSDFSHPPPPGFLPWPASRGLSPVFKSWDQRRDTAAARLSTADRRVVSQFRSDSIDVGVVEAVYGKHAVVRFDDDTTQEVPLSWFVARLEPGKRVIAKPEGSPELATIVSSSPSEGIVLELSSDGTRLQVSPDDLVTEVTTLDDDLIGWRVMTPEGVGKVLGVSRSPEEAVSVMLPGSRAPITVPLSSVTSAGPRAGFKSCKAICNQLMMHLKGEASAVDDAPIKARLPMGRGLHRETHSPRRIAQPRVGSSLAQQGSNTLVLAERKQNDEQGTWDRTNRARWALAAYFGAVPSFAGVDTATIPEDGINGVRKADVIAQLQEQALLARQWILLAMGQVADGLKETLAGATMRRKMNKAMDMLMGSRSKGTMRMVLDTLEASYVSMVNIIFRYEPVIPLKVDWTDQIIYPSALYHGPTCTEEEYEAGCEGCTPDTYAYVYPGEGMDSIDEHGRRIVNLCPLFFSQTNDLSEMDQDLPAWQGTRVGTLIHEVSHHFPSGTDDVIDLACGDPHKGTEDACYGFDNCRNLAANSTAKAVENADNVLYLTEVLTRNKQVHEERWSSMRHGSLPAMAAWWDIGMDI